MKHKSVKYLLCFFLMSSVAFDVAGMFGNAAFNFGVAAVGAFCGGASRFGVQFGGNGQFQGTFAQVRDPFGRLVVDVNPKPELKDISPIRPRIEMNGGEDIARASFSGWAPNTRYDVQFVDGLEYHRANDGHAEFWSLAQGRGWNQTDRPLIGVTHFAGQPDNLEFETTPLVWHFDTKIINGRRYNHAWTDTLLDFMVPEGERHRICAPSWYIRQHEAEQKKLRTEICKATLELTQQRVAEGFLQEANWGALNAAREINLHHRTEARNIATEALFYYEKAVEALRPIGGFVERVFEEMSVPGGVENLRKYRDGRLTSQEYDLIVKGELASDATAAMVGAFIGGTGGAVAGAPAGPVAAVAVSDIGAAKGAAAGYVASKATRAVARAIMNFSTGAGSGGDRTRTSEVRERKVDTQADRDKCWNDMKKSRKWEHYNGPYTQPTLRNRKTGDYVQKSREKWEIEVYDKHENHIGVIKPSDGKFHPELAVKGRKMRK